MVIVSQAGASVKTFPLMGHARAPKAGTHAQEVTLGTVAVQLAT